MFGLSSPDRWMWSCVNQGVKIRNTTCAPASVWLMFDWKSLYVPQCAVKLLELGFHSCGVDKDGGKSAESGGWRLFPVSLKVLRLMLGVELMLQIHQCVLAGGQISSISWHNKFKSVWSRRWCLLSVWGQRSDWVLDRSEHISWGKNDPEVHEKKIKNI